MIPTTTIENPSNTLTALIRATKIVTKSAAPRSANLDRVRTVSLQGCRAGVGWSRASTISSSQRKLIIVTRPLQVNPSNPRHPPVIRTGTANAIQAATAMSRMRRENDGRRLVLSCRHRRHSFRKSDPEEVDECGDDAEAGEDPGQPRTGVEELVHPPAPRVAEAHGDREHQADRRRLEQRFVLAELLVRVAVVIVRHGA